MATEAQVREALHQVLDPEIGRPIDELGMLEAVRVLDATVEVDVLLTIEGCPLRDTITRDVTAAVAPLPGVEDVRVSMRPMSDEQRGALASELRGGRAETPTFFTQGDTAVVAIASGKGGVGKSSVTVNLAASLAAEGHRVGILDADVWGFSVPRMMGVHGGRPVGFNDMIMPLESHGVKIISMGFFVPEEEPVIWRGPMLHKAIEQFLGDVYWGNLDILLADLPPGTGDVSISLSSFLPGASMVVVTTPQEAARKVAERAGKMAEQTKMRAIGVIENMSYFSCPGCGERTSIFGEGGGAEAAATLGVPMLGQIPLMPALRQGGDSGTPIVISDPESEAGEALRSVGRELVGLAKTKVRKPLQLMVPGGAGGGHGGHAGHDHSGHSH